MSDNDSEAPISGVYETRDMPIPDRIEPPKNPNSNSSDK